MGQEKIGNENIGNEKTGIEKVGKKEMGNKEKDDEMICALTADEHSALQRGLRELRKLDLKLNREAGE